MVAKLTSNRRAGERNKQGIDGENADEEGNEKGVEEHDDKKEWQITTAPGLKLKLVVSCAAAEEKKK